MRCRLLKIDRGCYSVGTGEIDNPKTKYVMDGDNVIGKAFEGTAAFAGDILAVDYLIRHFLECERSLVYEKKGSWPTHPNLGSLTANPFVCRIKYTRRTASISMISRC